MTMDRRVFDEGTSSEFCIWYIVCDACDDELEVECDESIENEKDAERIALEQEPEWSKGPAEKRQFGLFKPYTAVYQTHTCPDCK